MNKQAALSLAASMLLVCQLASLEVNPQITEYARGITYLRDDFKLPTKAYRAVEAVFSSSQTTNPVEIIFTGDVLLARNVEHLMEKHGLTYPFAGIDFSRFATAPSVIGNFESAVPQSHIPTETGELRFSVPAENLTALTMAGFTHLSLANNHTLDFGTDGYQNTGAHLLKSGLTPFGDPKQLSTNSVTFINTGASNVAIIALHALRSLPSDSQIEAVVAYASTVSDLQILYVHWGEEYVLAHNATQRKLAEKFVEQGIDLIVGHHPHVVQDVERIHNALVFYSLGNFVFDQYETIETQESLLLQLTLSDEPMVQLIPVSSAGSLSQPRLLEPKKHAIFLNQLAARSETSLAKYIRSGQVPLYSLVATSTKMAMMNK